MILVHKIAIDSNNAQAKYFARASGTKRFAYNWALAEWKRQYEAGEKPNEMALRRQLNAIKRDEFPWMLEVTKAAPQQGIKDLGQAFRRFFAGQARYPRFKKRGIHDSFRADNGPDTIRQDGRRLRLPVIGWVRLREPIRFRGQIKSVTISRMADRWFPSSKTCSTCGHVLDRLDLSVRSWACPICGEIHDRDLNAAINLRNLAASSAVSACGEESSGVGPVPGVKLASAKQEPNTKSIYA